MAKEKKKIKKKNEDKLKLFLDKNGVHSNKHSRPDRNIRN